ncbi:hypothetical protein Sd1012_4773, partial [Shigella dysenteriae 1012]
MSTADSSVEELFFNLAVPQVSLNILKSGRRIIITIPW